MQINIKLDKNFTTVFNKMCEEYGENLRKLNGFSDSQLNYTDFIDNFIDKNVKTVADASIDGNANASTRDITSLEIEMSKPHSKLLAFNKIFFEMNKKYGYKDAFDWLENEWDGHFYLHDAFSSTFKSYCFAYDIEELVNKGLYFIDTFNNQPPKHLTTYVDFVGEFVSWTSNRTSGACGLPSFLIYSYYFWKKDIETNYQGLNTSVVPGKWNAVKRIFGLMKKKDAEYRKQMQDNYRDQEFQRIIYKLNQPYLRVTQSAFTNFSIFDESYLVEIFGGKKFPDGTPMIDYIDEIKDYQKRFMEVCSAIRSQNMMTFPVLTYALLRDEDGKWADEEYAKWCCKHNMAWADSNFFVSKDVTSLSNCCRLISDVKNLGYFNSIGGTALEVGSIKVNTVNLVRIAYENDKENYLKALREKITLCCKTLDVVRHIIERNVEKGLLPNYDLKIINIKSQYNTIGVIGIYEACDKYGLIEVDEFGNHYYTEEGLKFAEDILATITEVKNEFAQDKDYMINIEQIPAERAASILQHKNKVFFPAEKYEKPLIGNQWLPLAVKCTLQEKIRVSAALDKACSGGSIAHINLQSPFTDFDQAWKILNDVADKGVNYFAFCLRISACAKNHGFFGETCPICGGEKVTSYQRIVGFLTPESSYSSDRKAEFQMRDWFDVNDGFDLTSK